MDKITNNIINNIPKKDVKDTNPHLNASMKTENVDDILSSNVVDIKVAKIKEAISSGKYPLDLDKLSDALMQAYREMKS